MAKDVSGDVAVLVPRRDGLRLDHLSLNNGTTSDGARVTSCVLYAGNRFAIFDCFEFEVIVDES